ncbi:MULTISPECIES: CHASE2 domain-containing protein [unclassified Tolypothrix]|uniref:CHASE2 domain-containing protein n=1 Tax=unclassified Tolypothrix TaxID=2649714 RepID=UPI0005EAB713|nr:MULTISPECIES: CHASE2 domain-containing protein [unclassified Tolypothrix]BAY93678.1 putative Chase2 sensor protein [Microchaete diplosiphon NIES-3275]EKE96642.1 putative CHASE2 domain protein [Tolypothrix sp. PCC 7601]MBE9086072.1 CHASE2 domain-containing protein [Tolypothrix sp. LEGE 11397]UYD27499.1 CHASE2 domain-containing protein [Tolypothrix sp. PCC 7712]UYD36638.1 CHASE2 domain-containing protein [Tolypothrix sp. PCC 7601]
MSNFYLKVQHIEKLCLFQLSWGKGQQLNVTIPYPQNLTILYQDWQRSYLNYYKNYKTQSVRGRIADSGVISTPPTDWQAKLVQAEAKFLLEFHKWLRCAELYEIRMALANVVGEKEKIETLSQSPEITNLFLTCNTIDLERFPWESWEIGTEFALSSGKIRIVRTPVNIHRGFAQKNPRLTRKVRVLAILGDETGLDFKAEKQAMRQFKNIIDVKFVGLQPETSITDLKTKIKDAITSELGWDILFFAGHSNENNITGGEISIAKNVTLSISEIAPLLSIAVERGLQFAIFNSCNGLNIANSLIDLGLSQVAVMREPVHNAVAEEFLLHFLQALAEFKDVHEALLLASQYLKTEKNLTYPSAYLIPSLFRHPEAPLFKVEPFGIKQRLRKIIPTRKEGIALAALLLISLQIPIQNHLLGRKLWVQSLYRQLTGKVNQQEVPPVLLVKIDDESIKKSKGKISNPRPMNREYIASLINRLTDRKAKIIGIDFILDRHQPENDKSLAQAIKKGVNTSPNPTWFIFAGTESDAGVWQTAIPEIASFNWSLDGEIEILFCDKIQRIPCYMTLLPSSNNNSTPFTFAGLLALSHQLQYSLDDSSKDSNNNLKIPQPKLDSQSNFWQQLNSYLNRNKHNILDKTILNSPRSRLQPIADYSTIISQMWLHPIIDFSIPPNQIYESVPAWKLLEQDSKNLPLANLQKQVVIIAAGGYDEAGMSIDKEDNFDVPPALDFWRLQQGNNSRIIPGGEVHAYMVHHFLTQRLVIPIPDVWILGIAILMGKYFYYLLRKHSHYCWQWLMLISLLTVVYGIISLEIYISSLAIIIPWFLPSATVWTYFITGFLRRRVYE